MFGHVKKPKAVGPACCQSEGDRGEIGRPELQKQRETVGLKAEVLSTGERMGNPCLALLWCLAAAQ